MLSAVNLIYHFSHPQELLAIIYWKGWRRPVHPRDKSRESPNIQECYRLLALTSRSFVAVIQELDPELLMPVVVFYLVLRALDTIEDDMTLPLEQKEPLLRKFHSHMDDETWTFDGSGPNEKDREVLVKFDTVSREFNRLKDQYRVIIRDIARSMGNGMADYAAKAAANPNGVSVKTVTDYKLYCHYVAGLVGEGLTRLFVEAKFADPALLEEKPHLMESMGQLLQQVNITRDVREDYDQKRYFWPKEVWSKYVDTFGELFLPQNRERALQCSSEMVCMGLSRAEDCLAYMSRVEEQSTFNFVAIPQAMAIATFELCFQNPELFDRNIKMSRGSACRIMIDSTQGFPRLCEVFRHHAKRIRQKNRPGDPHFTEIDAACSRIERFVEARYPSGARRRAHASEQWTRLAYLACAFFAFLVAYMASQQLLHDLFVANKPFINEEKVAIAWTNYSAAP
ncbi:hypothetical protein KVR01_012876 [Diaporthe batatas]|uniref:uncharacterized protein n=1 Tax=Diaporthe batatas TaxID=748121 RepID=UPI001D04D157|nr:uncharacterized protein KVR01_012876 [Diaporthe batatas]KAG8157168.1 hypothetical protein KVR01_012876 [Diaporthe batatas]